MHNRSQVHVNPITMPKVALLSSVSGEPHLQRLVLVPDTRADAETEIDRILVALGADNPHFTWEHATQALRAAGFTPIDDVVEIVRPWDESRCRQAMTFSIQFPADAAHEHAGKTLRASTWLVTEAIPLALLDEHGQCLTADDRLWKLGAEGTEQVPLGTILLPAGQFASQDQVSHAHALLTESGFSVTVIEMGAHETVAPR